MADDIVTRLRYKQRQREPWDMNKEPIFAEAADEIERLRAELAEAYDACRYALADSSRWQELAATVVHTYEEARRG